MSITRQVKLIDKYKFAKVALNKNSKPFMIYITGLSTSWDGDPLFLDGWDLCIVGMSSASYATVR